MKSCLQCRQEDIPRWLCDACVAQVVAAARGQRSVGWLATYWRWWCGVIAMCLVGFQLVYIVVAAASLDRPLLGIAAGVGAIPWLMLSTRLNQSDARVVVPLYLQWTRTRELHLRRRLMNSVWLLLREGNMLVMPPWPVLAVAVVMLVWIIRGPTTGTLGTIILLGMPASLTGCYFSWFHYGDWVSYFNQQLRRSADR